MLGHLHGPLPQNIVTRFAILFVERPHHTPISMQMVTLHMWLHRWGISLGHATTWLPDISKLTLAKHVAQEWLLPGAIYQIKNTSGHSHCLSCWIINRKTRQWFTIYAWDACIAVAMLCLVTSWFATKKNLCILSKQYFTVCWWHKRLIEISPLMATGDPQVWDSWILIYRYFAW